jgi:TrkA-N domain
MIITGFGRVGQTVGAMLQVHKVPYVAVDRDADRVVHQRANGAPVYFGDMRQIELLRRLHLSTARALVVTLDDHAATDELVIAARAERNDLLIIARARDADHAAHLYRVGASNAVPETIEASLQLSEAVLVDVGVPVGPVIASIHEKRAGLQAVTRAWHGVCWLNPPYGHQDDGAGRRGAPVGAPAAARSTIGKVPAPVAIDRDSHKFGPCNDDHDRQPKEPQRRISDRDGCSPVA